MDQTIAKALRKAYEYVKAGNKEAARPIVVEVLKRDPELEQAWLLLSLVVDDQKRQLYALKQVLRINPSNERARGRLEKMTGESIPVSSEPEQPLTTSSPFTTTPTDEPVTQAASHLSENGPPAAGDDLLNQRLFGNGDDAPSFTDTAEVESTEVVETESNVDEYSAFREENLAKKKKRTWLRPALLITLIMVLFAGAVYLYTQGYIGGGSTSNIVANEGTVSDIDEVQSTEEPTLESSATQIGLALPSTWTPAPEISPTPLPTATAISVPAPTVATVNLLPEVEEAILNIQRQVGELREVEISGELKAPVVINPNQAEDILTGLAAAMGVDDQADRDLYEMLGLMRSNQNLDNYYLNLLIDPLGGIYLPSSNEIYLVGLGVGAKESYAYTHQYVHYLMDETYDFVGLGYDPDCIWSYQQCVAIRAFIEGDGVVVREAWLDTYSPEIEAPSLRALSTNYRMLTTGEIPGFALADLAFYYQQGPIFVAALIEANGYEYLEEVYLSPPMTTEQILHPDKYLDGEFEIFIDDAKLSEVLGTGWEERTNGSFGEWMTQLILTQALDPLAQLDRADAAEAAGGWGGDFYQLYANADSGESILGVHWQWDSVEDAEEFYSYLLLYLSGRFRGDSPDWTVDAACFGGEMVSCATQIGDHVYWVTGDSLENVELISQFYIDSAPSSE